MKCSTKGGKINGAFFATIVKYKKHEYIKGNEYNGLVELYDIEGNLVNTVKRTKRGFRKL